MNVLNSPMKTPSRLRAAFAPFFCAVVALASGCGGSVGSLHEVKGKVTIDGNPMSGGSVRFVPDTAKGNKSGLEPVGVIGTDGTYTVATAGKPGAPEGW